MIVGVICLNDFWIIMYFEWKNVMKECMVVMGRDNFLYNGFGGQRNCYV